MANCIIIGLMLSWARSCVQPSIQFRRDATSVRDVTAGGAIESRHTTSGRRLSKFKATAGIHRGLSKFGPAASRDNTQYIFIAARGAPLGDGNATSCEVRASPGNASEWELPAKFYQSMTILTYLTLKTESHE